MDRAQFYRTLGVQPEASAREIKEAYEERIRRYHLSDYDDEPEYVAAKIRELNEAYTQIMGSGPITIATKAKTLAKYFNKDSDHGVDDFDRCGDEEEERGYEQGSFLDKLGEKGRQVWVDRDAKRDIPYREQESRDEGRSRKPFSRSTHNQDRNKTVAGVAIAIIIFVIIAIFGTVMSIIEEVTYYPDLNNSYEESIAASVDRIHELNKVLDGMTAFNYDDFLIDNEGAFDQYIERTPSDKTYAEWWGANYDVMHALGLEYESEVFEAMTGDPEFYYNYSDEELTHALTELMRAPAYEEIAGMTDAYSMSQIVDYISYMGFLRNVADYQLQPVLDGNYVSVDDSGSEFLVSGEEASIFASEGAADWKPATPSNETVIDLGEWGDLTIQAENGTVVEIN